MHIQTDMAIPVAFLAIAFLLCWYIIFAKGFWIFKAVLIIFVAYISLSLWTSLDLLKGWPVREFPPDKTIVYGFIAKEPVKHKQFDGELILWLVAVNDKYKLKELNNKSLVQMSSLHKGEPRAYIIPYSRPLHEKLRALQNSGQMGKIVMNFKSARKKVRKGGKRGVKYMFEIPEKMFYKLPPIKMPPKPRR